MEYNSTQRTQTVYRTADGGWKQESYCVVHRVENQHRRNGSSGSENNIVTSTVRERFQQSRNLGSDGHLERRQDLGGVPGWPKIANQPGDDPKACGLLGNMQRKWSSQLGHYGNKLYDFAASNIFARDQGAQVRPRQNIGNDDFDVIERHELADLRDDPHPSNHGHRFVPVSLKAPNWCDKCGEFIWGMYKHCYICINCRYTCHLKCRQAVTLQCHVRAYDDSKTDEETTETCFTSEPEEDDEEDDESGYYTCRSTAHGSLERSDSQGRAMWTREKLTKRIDMFNLNNHGLQMNMELRDGRNTFQGFIRVHMNLIRPINVSISPNPPSHYSALTHETENGSTDENTQVMSFYLPKNTSKVIHISSATTAQEVIRALLAKFKITDNPRKFALYEKNLGNRKTGVMRRMGEDELPLAICLCWTDGGIDQLDSNMFILQENDTGEIMWDAFSLPELENFLSVLNREEEEHTEQVREKFRLFRIQLLNQARKKEGEDVRQGRRVPVFV